MQQPRAGGRAAVFNHQQEQEICNMAIGNNSIRLREIQSAIINDLKIHQMTMKQLYKVPFERNSERLKELWYQYVQVNYWCKLSEFYCTSKMPVLFEVLETQKKRKNLLNFRIKNNFIMFLCFFIENRGVRRT